MAIRSEGALRRAREKSNIWWHNKYNFDEEFRKKHREKRRIYLEKKRGGKPKSFHPAYDLKEILNFALELLKKNNLNIETLLKAVKQKYPSYQRETARGHLGRIILETGLIKKIQVDRHYEYVLA